MRASTVEATQLCPAATISFSASGLTPCGLETGCDVQDPHRICLALINGAKPARRETLGRDAKVRPLFTSSLHHRWKSDAVPRFRRGRSQGQGRRCW